MNNQECKTRTKTININNNEPVFYSFSIRVNKCIVSCNNINDPYATVSFSNQTKHIEWHETCKCKCILDASVCNNEQRWNEDKCRCECREELIDKERCDKGLVWNASNCNCEFDKSCDI